MVLALVLLEPLKGRDVPRAFDHADDRIVPFIRRADVTDLLVSEVLADLAVVDGLFRLKDRRGEVRRLFLGHIQHKVGEPSRRFPADAGRAAKCSISFFNGSGSPAIGYQYSPGMFRPPEMSFIRVSVSLSTWRSTLVDAADDQVLQVLDRLGVDDFRL